MVCWLIALHGVRGSIKNLRMNEPDSVTGKNDKRSLSLNFPHSKWASRGGAYKRGTLPLCRHFPWCTVWYIGPGFGSQLGENCRVRCLTGRNEWRTRRRSLRTCFDPRGTLSPPIHPLPLAKVTFHSSLRWIANFITFTLQQLWVMAFYAITPACTSLLLIEACWQGGLSDTAIMRTAYERPKTRSSRKG